MGVGVGVGVGVGDGVGVGSGAGASNSGGGVADCSPVEQADERKRTEAEAVRRTILRTRYPRPIEFPLRNDEQLILPYSSPFGRSAPFGCRPFSMRLRHCSKGRSMKRWVAAANRNDRPNPKMC